MRDKREDQNHPADLLQRGQRKDSYHIHPFFAGQGQKSEDSVHVQADQRTWIGWVGWRLLIPTLSFCSQSGRQTKRLVLDPSSKLPLYKQTASVKAPSPAKQSQGSGNQAKSQDRSAASGGQYCIYQKPKQVTCNVAHMKRVTNKYKYYCGQRSQGKLCTGYRWAQLSTSPSKR